MYPRKRGRGRIITSELHIRRLRVDEAIHKLDQYLNDAFMNHLSQVRVIHGKGKGILRKSVETHLKQHLLVESYRRGEWSEGGEGITVVFLVRAWEN